jgi:subtilase family serine protease
MKRSRALFASVLAVLLLAGGPAFAAPRSPGNVELSVSSMTLEAAHAGPPAVNDVIFINATLENMGDEPAFNVTVLFSYNTTGMPELQVGMLALNATGTVIEPFSNTGISWPWNTSGLDLSPGQNYTVYVDVVNDTQPANQSDPDLSNNRARQNITFAADVVPSVTDLASSDDNAVVGDTVTFLAKLANSGIRPALAEPVSFFLDGSSSPFCTTAADIPAAGTSSATGAWDTTGATDGRHNITARVRESSRTVPVSLKYRVNPYIASVKPSSYSARVGDVLAINVTLDNNGVEAARDVAVDFYLDARGVPMGNLTANEVRPGTPESLSFLWDTAGTDLGVHSVKARIAGTAKEMRTGNITLDVELFPDLAVDAVTVGDNAPLVGTVLNISISISNIGEAAPKANTTLQVLLDSVETVFESPLEPLAPGAYFNTSFEWDTSAVTPANHTLRVQVNAYGDFPELNDGNNDRVVQLRFRGSLDLSVRSIAFSKTLNQSNATEEVTAGEPLWIWVNVQNRGSLSSAQNTTLALSLDGGAPFKSVLLYSIAPGRNFTAQIAWDTSGLNDTAVSVRSVRAVVDPAGLNDDSDPSNNALSVNLTVRPAVREADIAVAAVRAANPAVRYDEVLMITATLTNLGGREARNFTVRFTYQSGPSPQPIGDLAVALLAPGEARNATMPWRVVVAEGNYTVSAAADPQNSVLETNEANNAGSTRVQVLPVEVLLPELRLGTPAVQPPEPRKGQTVNISVTITNTGKATATGLTVTLLAAGKSAGELDIPDLAPGASRTVSLAWKAESGGTVLVLRVSGQGIAPADSASVRVDTAGALAEEGGPWWPIAVLIVALVAVAAAMMALGGRKTQKDEEE